MAGVQLTLIQSRVGRRVATLFVLCGLVPLLVLSGVVSWLVSSHLRSREEERLRALAKESAMASVERLLDVEERLRVVASQPGAVAPDSLRGVTALVRLDQHGRPVPLFGRTSAPALDAAARARLGAGRAVIRLPARPDDPIHVVVPTTGAARYDGSALVAALDLRAVWGLDERTGDGRVAREACGAVPSRRVLDCSDGVADRQALAAAIGSPGPDTFVAQLGGEEWMGARWSAPLQSGFGVADWTGVVVSRTADTLAPARALARTVGLLVVSTFCLVLLVSFQQIRRLLDPITKLHHETARLAQGDFSARVDVLRTGDELQGLCDAFNAMAGDLQRQFAQLHALSVGTLEALARAIDAKSPWTAGHSTRVTEIALAIGRAMRLDAPALDRISRGALLHDIGKIGISADILDKAGPLTAAEIATIREHPATGARILEPLPHCADILPMVLQHHERFDGSGYPAGLAGTQIAFEARILAVADVYDAMTSDRPYRRGMPPRDVAVYIAAGAGTHFDRAVVEAFGDAFRTGRIPPAATATSSRIA